MSDVDRNALLTPGTPIEPNLDGSFTAPVTGMYRMTAELPLEDWRVGVAAGIVSMTYLGDGTAVNSS